MADSPDMHQSIMALGLMEDSDIVLDEAALALAALDREDADLGPGRQLLALMTGQLADGGDADAPRAQAAALARIIADDHGFRGDTETYDDPANADLIAVLERRRGLPVALSIIYVALARRLGWVATALNTPGHVLVRIGAGRDAVVIDPFSGGVPIARDALLQLLARGGGLIRPDHLPALSNQATLARLLLNQATRARQAGDLERALELYRRLTTVAPLVTALWQEQAALEQQAGLLANARRSLQAALETTRDPNLRTTLQTQLQQLARSSH